MAAKKGSRKILVLSGPNLNLLGQREPEIYGTDSLADHMLRVDETAKQLGLTTEKVSAQSAAELVAAIHAARSTCDAIIINPGALTHFAWSLHDALASFAGPIIEVHLSNPSSREPWRHESVVAPVASGTIAGFGANSYVFAVHAVATLLSTEK
ncbi:MAG: 3-dehydroquinate dehydratase [Actinobacteria bacterium]|nr:3-dehydroquinate dehydratase [Actinomycetota bacterium]